jgi:ABC-type polar amino acid transport system ATPase subunit
LSLLDYPDSGKITWDDKNYRFPVSDKKFHPAWPKVTVVFQQLFIWPHLTLRQNILLPLGNITAEHTAHLKELVDIFDMGAFIDRYPNETSLGQRQRAAIVRALMLNPEYLLLDEITSSLDVEQINSILSHLKVVKERGVGILMVTHLVNFAQQVSDNVIFIDGGEIIEFGGVEILKSPKHERVQKFLSVIKAVS